MFAISNVKKILFFAIIFSLILTGRSVYAQCSSQEECSNLIQQYSGEIVKLQGQAKTLKNQIAQFDAQIKLTSLKIAQTQDQISLLSGRIVQLGDSLNSLATAFSSRAIETYKLSRFENNFIYLISAADVKDVFSRMHYLEKIQEEDRQLLQRLQEAQTSYQGQKVDQETLQKQLKDQQASLNAQKRAKNQLLADTQGSEARYQTLLSQAQAQLNAFRNYVNSQGGATILENQTHQSDWGYYYNQRDSKWGRMSIGASGVSMADAGCLVTSVAMIATHVGKNISPSDIAGSLTPFVTGTAYMRQSWSDLGMNVVRMGNPVYESLIDSELAANHPVIVGLYGSYSYPQHFIVIKGKDARGFIMNDPFLENGYDRPLTDKYSFGNIVRIDKVTIN